MIIADYNNTTFINLVGGGPTIEETISKSPEGCMYFERDDSRITIEVSLPGVKKEDISLKLQEDTLVVSVPRDDIKFMTMLSIRCPVVAEMAEATYNNGLLRITAPLKDAMDSAIKIVLK
jgi:HSP20 family molecular chaperone IbpA